MTRVSRPCGTGVPSWLATEASVFHVVRSLETSMRYDFPYEPSQFNRTRLIVLTAPRSISIHWLSLNALPHRVLDDPSTAASGVKPDPACVLETVTGRRRARLPQPAP